MTSCAGAHAACATTGLDTSATSAAAMTRSRGTVCDSNRMDLGRLCLAATAAALIASSPASAHTGPTLRLTLDPNASTVVDLGAPGKSPGDRYAIDAPVRDASGTL